MENKTYKRKNYVIDKDFQYGFIATFLFLVVLALLIFSAGFYVYYWVMYMTGDNIFKEFITIQKTVTVNIQLLTKSDLKNPSSLVLKLKNSDDALSKYIKENLKKSSVDIINGFSDKDTLNAQAINQLLSDLNYFLEERVYQEPGICLYSESRFKNIKISDDLIAQARKTGRGRAL